LYSRLNRQPSLLRQRCVFRNATWSGTSDAIGGSVEEK
jgi:hypothetical protein